MKTSQNSTLNFEISIRKAISYAGIGFLMSFVGAIYAAYATNSENIIANEGLFRSGIFGYLVAIFGDIIRAWALYIIFKNVNKSMALLSAWFMLIHDAIFGAALVNLIFSVAITTENNLQAIFETSQVDLLNSLFKEGFNYGFQIGLLIFSLHLATIGYLVQKSGKIPFIFSILLYIAAFGYFINSSIVIILPEYPEIIWTIFMAPCLIGELAIILWLVIKGKNRLKESIS